jgi:RND family efflux transporter MFP subunit
MIEIENFKKERYMKRINFSYSALFLSGLMVSLAGCSHKRELDPRTQPELVRIVEVGSSSGSDRAFTGVVSARVQSDLGFRVPGKVTKRLVDTGQFVHVGQLLMTIDRTDYVHAITARAESVTAAKAKAVQTAADESRYRPLVKSGAVSASIYDQIKAASDAAQADLAAAKAQEQVARDEEAYSQLIADSDGVVIETLAEPGQVVAAGQTVVKLAHSGPREAAVNLPETLKPALRSTAYAALYGSTVRVPVRLRQLSNAADPQTRTFEARYVLDGAAANAPLGGNRYSPPRR